MNRGRLFAVLAGIGAVLLCGAVAWGVWGLPAAARASHPHPLRVVESVAIAPAAVSPGSFASADPLLDTIWRVSVQTARSMVLLGRLWDDALGDICRVDLRAVIVDGLPRDRCPFVGDLAVTDRTLAVSTPGDLTVVRSMLAFFAHKQLPNGGILASTERGGEFLFDYNAYWVIDVYDYVLYSGDVAFADEVWPNLVRVLDGWFPAQTQSDGLIVNSRLLPDYSYFPSQQPLVAYFNAQYALALEDAAALARWTGRRDAARAWLAREAALARPFNRTFWDGSVGAYRDSPTGPVVHPQDGNSFAVLAGLATPARARSALAYLGRADARSYGNTIADTNAWDTPTEAETAASQVVFPFMSYFEVLARYREGEPDQALALIRREWGYMVEHGPHQGMWETIGPGGGPPIGDPSWDHGWSSGAAPALTAEFLGVVPTSPGFRTFRVDPHPSGVAWARGSVPTPRGNITVSWSVKDGKLKLAVGVPEGDRIDR